MSAVNWRPSARVATLKKRADWMKAIRRFFDDRGYLEVETPIMAQHGVSDLYLQNIVALFRNRPHYLQTSPEYHMKRLLAAGSGPIYQISRVFRDDELGRWHNPEFTLLEWYQLKCDHHALIDEVADLFKLLLDCPDVVRMTYQDAFSQALSICPITATLHDLRACLVDLGLHEVLAPDEVDRDQYLFLLMSHHVEPYLATLNAPVAVYDFPKSQASLAQLNGEVACRFEIYYKGVELANGFYELTCPHLQRTRFDEDNQKRQQSGLPFITPDPYLLAALDAGLPPCSGVALGLDRLFAIGFGASSISEVLSFAYDIA